MNVSGYIVTNNQSSYDVSQTSQNTNTKPFTIPTFAEGKVIGAISPHWSDGNYDPFKDIAETGSVNFPGYLQTKSTSARSDEEILKDIEELAKEHARTGQSGKDDNRLQKLIDEYVSSVSPDRAGILKNAAMEIHERLSPQNVSDYTTSDIFQQIDSQKTDKKEEEKEPIDYFLEALKNKGNGKGNSGTITSITQNGCCTTINIDHGGGMTTALNYVNGEFTCMTISGNNYSVGGIENYSNAVTAANFFDSNGDLTMCYDGNNLSQVYTKEEGKRMQEGNAVYKAAYDVAIGNHLGVNSPNKEYNEAYNRAYERLASSAVA